MHDIIKYGEKSHRAEHTIMALKLAKARFDDRKIADIIGISMDQFNRWVEEIPEFRDALWNGRDLFDAEIVNAMGRAAIGYSHEEVKFFKFGRPGEEEIVRETFTRHYPPNVAAGEFLLTNRQKELWRKQTHQAMTDADGNTLAPPPVLVIQPLMPLSEPVRTIEGDVDA